MKKKKVELTDKQKLDYLIEKVNKIDATINPSLGKRFLQWCVSHWLIVVLVVGLLFSTIKMWDEIQTLISFAQKANQSIETVEQNYQNIKEDIGDLSNAVNGTVESLKFWE